MARVLVVDNAPDVVNMTALLLQVFGHETYTATSGAEAIEIAGRHRCDVAIIDIAMPVMNGLDLVEELHRIWGDSTTYVALTGWSTQSMRRMALEAGFDYYVVKPLEGRKLSGLIDHAMRKAG